MKQRPHSKTNHPYRGILPLAFGHMGADGPQGALAAILPYLIAAYHFDYTTAATLTMVANLVGSVVQPMFGQLADRRNICWTLIGGVLLAGGGIALTGMIPNFAGLCVAVMVMGIGVSMYHPEAALLVNQLADQKRLGTAISIFSFGGNGGFAVGPIIATGAIAVAGLKGTAVFFIIALAITFWILRVYPQLSAAHPAGTMDKPQAREFSASEPSQQGPGAMPDRPRDEWAAFWKLAGVIFGRSILYAGFNTFLALYWIERMGASKAQGSLVLTVFFTFAALSVLIGGRLADRFGHIKMIRLSGIILVPGAFLLAFAPNPAVGIIALLPISFAISLCYSPSVVLGQTYLPNRKGFASGITLGLSVSIGGIVAPLLGKIGDTYGLQTTMVVLAFITIVPFVFSLLLTEPGATKRVKKNRP